RHRRDAVRVSHHQGDREARRADRTVRRGERSDQGFPDPGSARAEARGVRRAVEVQGEDREPGLVVSRQARSDLRLQTSYFRTSYFLSRSGETGRRAGLKIPWRYPLRVGSIPTSGTKYLEHAAKLTAASRSAGLQACQRPPGSPQGLRHGQFCNALLVNSRIWY